MPMERSILSVSDVNQYLKQRMDQDPFLIGLCIRGEISNYKVYPSGHHYFSLKDSGGALRAVMFKGSAVRLRFRPENGMKVLAFGRISVFPRDGAYQLYCESLLPEGTGDLHMAFEQLKARLQEKGLFDPAHKKPLPPFPQRIAIITSSAGAAIHDMLRVLGKRYPLVKVILLPVRVQGVEAPAEICGAIRYVNRFRLADVIITGRGGGSMEDLWAFNDERLALTIYQSEIPVISAVGHEPDVTISDYVADLRAATPSNAAELVAPDQQELRDRLASIQVRLSQTMNRRLRESRQRLDRFASMRVLQNPMNYVEDRRLLLDHQQKQLIYAAQRGFETRKQHFIRLSAAMEAMSPLKVLARGYSVTKDQNGIVLTHAEDVRPGETITVILNSGELDAVVEQVRGGTDA